MCIYFLAGFRGYCGVGVCGRFLGWVRVGFRGAPGVAIIIR